METEQKNLHITIYLDEHAQDPREWDNLGTMVCAHRRYNLGDVQVKDEVEAYEEMLPDDVFAGDIEEECSDPDYEGEYLARLKAEAEKNNVILPLYLYDHGGISMRTTTFACPWDSGQVGFIYVSLKKLIEEKVVDENGEPDIERARECLRSEVKVYDQHLRDDCYGFEITDEDGEVVDSCWGFYGPEPKENGMSDHFPEGWEDMPLEYEWQR